MVYGIDITIDNELVFMVCINQHSHHWGGPGHPVNINIITGCHNRIITSNIDKITIV